MLENTTKSKSKSCDLIINQLNFKSRDMLEDVLYFILRWLKYHQVNLITNIVCINQYNIPNHVVKRVFGLESYVI